MKTEFSPKRQAEIAEFCQLLRAAGEKLVPREGSDDRKDFERMRAVATYLGIENGAGAPNPAVKKWWYEQAAPRGIAAKAIIERLGKLTADVVFDFTEDEIDGEAVMDAVEFEREQAMLPEKYDELPIAELAELAVEAIEDDGLFWMPFSRTPAQNLEAAVKELMPERSLYLHSPPPDWDHVLIDTDRLPDWPRWVDGHAATRADMKERGVPDHKLPPLPAAM